MVLTITIMTTGLTATLTGLTATTTAFLDVVVHRGLGTRDPKGLAGLDPEGLMPITPIQELATYPNRVDGKERKKRNKDFYFIHTPSFDMHMQCQNA